MWVGQEVVCCLPTVGKGVVPIRFTPEKSYFKSLILQQKQKKNMAPGKNERC